MSGRSPVVVTGATGQLGSAVVRRLGAVAQPLRRTDLDLTDVAAIAPAIAAARPGAIVNCAAFTAVDAAEDDAATAHTVNATAVGEMARIAAARSIPFVTFSSDYVFDGDNPLPYVESDPPRPRNAYGRSKLAGEVAAQAAHSDCLVIRTSWLLSGTHRNFMSVILGKARAGPVRVVADQRGRPTFANDLAAATVAAVEAGVTGILHLANRDATTWADLARAALAVAGLDPDLVVPCTTAEFPTRAVRPANGVLESERIEALGLDPLPPWRTSLPAAVSALLARGDPP